MRKIIWNNLRHAVEAGIQNWTANHSNANLYIMKQPCVYLLSSRRNGTLYAGVTSNLPKRVWEHRNHVMEGFTKKYGVDRLVWYEQHETMESAIAREKVIKSWKRVWKVELIEADNSEWLDLYETLF